MKNSQGAVKLYAESLIRVWERESFYYLESSEEHFHVIHNQWVSINPFRMLNAGNHVNFKVFPDDNGGDDDDDDDWYDNFVTPLASNVYLYAYVSECVCVRAWYFPNMMEINEILWKIEYLDAYTLYDWLCTCVRARIRYAVWNAFPTWLKPEYINSIIQIYMTQTHRHRRHRQQRQHPHPQNGVAMNWID